MNVSIKCNFINLFIYFWSLVSVCIARFLSVMFPVKNGMKQGGALLPLVFNFALEYAIRGVKVSLDGLKLNGAHQLLVSADDVNILGGRVHTIEKNRSFSSC